MARIHLTVSADDKRAAFIQHPFHIFTEIVSYLIAVVRLRSRYQHQRQDHQSHCRCDKDQEEYSSRKHCHRKKIMLYLTGIEILSVDLYRQIVVPALGIII